MASPYELHTGDRPDAFVCDKCEYTIYRCSSGARMWVFNKKSEYGKAERMLCDMCYTLELEGIVPVELDRKTGTRQVFDDCGNCYYFGFPCLNHTGFPIDEASSMTYEEFRGDNDPSDYPETYEEFLKTTNFK